MCAGIKYVSCSIRPSIFAVNAVSLYLLPAPTFLRGTLTELFAYSLAYTELYLTLGHLFRKFDMTVHGTSDADMELKDCAVAKTMGELKVKLRDSKE